MYCEYWSLDKPPFDNVPDPSMYSDSHTSMENVISETIFAIKEGNECFAVIIGEVGLGKTLSLRIIIDSLEPNKYRVVLVTNPSISFTQLLREIIGQATGRQCHEKNKFELLEIFNRLLFETVDAGQKIVVFIDEANAITPANLENLRLLTNMQDDHTNLFTLVLAGQLELARRLEHPKRANLFQRIGTYSRIDKLPSPNAVKNYIETRLKLTGAKRKIFTDDCYPVIWEYSEKGVPRLINKICKLCLKAGETNDLRMITGDIVEQIALRFEKLSQTAYQKRKPRSRPDMEFTEEEIAAIIDPEQLKDLPALASTLSAPPHDHRLAETIAPPGDDHTIGGETTPPSPREMIDDQEEISSLEAESISSRPPSEEFQTHHDTSGPTDDHSDFLDLDLSDQEPPQPTQEDVPATTEVAVKDETVLMAPDDKPRSPETLPPVTPPPVNRDLSEMADDKPASKPVADSDEDEVTIAGHRIHLNIPKAILKQVGSFNPDNANKSAGFWAAQIIKNNPQLTRSTRVDPVNLWNEIKESILKRIEL